MKKNLGKQNSAISAWVLEADTVKSPKRVVILGASGFIASNLKKLLESRGIVCRAIASSEIDLCDEKSPAVLAQIVTPEDALVMTSMITPDKGKDAAVQEKNIRMGKHAADFLTANSCQHVIYLSSDAVYPDSVSLMTEKTYCGPDSLYGAAHLTREKMILEAAKKKSTPYLIVRPSAIYGPQDTHNGYGPNRFMRSASKENRIALFGNGEEKRDHIYIKDICELLILSLQHQTEGILNAVTGQALSFMEVAQAVKALKGPEVKIEPSPRANPVTHRHFDNAKLLKTFPSFRFTPFEEGLKTMFSAAGS